ncbi:MAG: hypothetical protein FWD39_02690 [Clostridiales bacterium]|nr:hypothetical protein [Clostridiales bacterium]
MKKRFIALGMLLIFAIALAGCVGNGMVFSGSSSGMRKELKDGSWKITAKSINGTATRTVYMNALDVKGAMRVTNANSEGKVFLIISQGDVEKTVELSGEFSEDIDMSDFEPGSVKLRLKFEKAKDVKVTITWTIIVPHN